MYPLADAPCGAAGGGGIYMYESSQVQAQKLI